MTGFSTCEQGLFIGVDKYPTLSRERRLNSAGRDAMTLMRAFQHASPDGRWSSLVENALVRPTRAVILGQVFELVRSVPDNAAGLIYFAGHATLRNAQLILSCADYRPSLAEDTGVKLSRILSIIKAKANAGARFVVVLDCCRDSSSDNHFLGDDIPANVSVVYAVASGEHAEETKEQGIFTLALIRASTLLATQYGATLGRTATLWHIYEKLVETCHDVSRANSSPEFVGMVGTKVLLPLLVETSAYPHDSDIRLPEATIVAQLQSEKELDDVYTFTKSILKQWGVTDFDRYVRQTVEKKTVNLSFKGSARELSAVEHLLHQCRFEFSRIVIMWPNVIDESHVFAIRHRLKDPSIGTSKDGNRELHWLNETSMGRFRGVMWVSRFNGEHTNVEIACQSLDGIRAPLFFLLPSFLDVVARLLTIKGVSEHEK